VFHEDYSPETHAKMAAAARGYGRIIMPDGEEHEGYYQKLVPHGYGKFWNPIQQFGYEGMFAHGSKEGAGEFICPEFTYRGHFTNDTFHGYGNHTVKDPVGNPHYYYGQYCRNMKCGFGVDVFNLTKYVGQMSMDNRNGKGKLTYYDGTYYEGEFKNGERHGRGLLKNSNGDTYAGTFVKGKRQGTGINYFRHENIVYIGQYNNDMAHGLGEVFMNAKSLHAGRWI